MIGVEAPQSEIDDSPDQTQNPIIEKARHSLEPIWNQLKRVLLPKNQMAPQTEAV
jgi:hypothetical protein